MTERPPFPGKVLSLDLGEKRIGLAISDETRLIAAPYGTITRRSRQADLAEYQRIIQEEEITLLVVGLPIPLSGGESQKTAWVRDYVAELRQHITIPIQFWDEALTTVEAQASLQARGIKGKKAQQRVDALAAVFILQHYLDAHASFGCP